MVRPDFLAEGTQDRSSAFLSTSNPNTDESNGRSGEDDVNASVPEAEDADIEALDDVSSGDANSIEAIAAAMLGEVERRATGTCGRAALRSVTAANGAGGRRGARTRCSLRR
jgi:hypothetical protein